jgi:hypothetical protein
MSMKETEGIVINDQPNEKIKKLKNKEEERMPACHILVKSKPHFQFGDMKL